MVWVLYPMGNESEELIIMAFWPAHLIFSQTSCQTLVETTQTYTGNRATFSKYAKLSLGSP